MDKNLQRAKTAWADEIWPEMLKALGKVRVVVTMPLKCCMKIWRIAFGPTDIIATIFKNWTRPFNHYMFI